MREIEVGDAFIGVVAQAPFESRSFSGVQNAFCTLQPLAFDDGQSTTPGDFPNRGLVWWMLTDNAHRFAQPGRLVSFIVERAPEHTADDPEKHLWQAKRTSVKPCTNEMVEILHVSSRDVQQQNDLVSTGSCAADHPPCATALVRWGDNLYGPLPTSPEGPDDAGDFVVRFAPPRPGRQVFRLQAAELDRVRDAGQRVFEVDVSRDSSMRNRREQAVVCSYELIPAAVYRELTRTAERVRLESDSAMLRRVAKDVLGWSRKERSSLKQLLEKFEEELKHPRDDADAESAIGVLQRTQARLEHNGQLAAEIAEALIGSGFVDQALEDGIEERYRQYVESRTAKTTADIAERVASLRQELDTLIERRNALDAEVESESRAKRASLKSELDEHRAAHDAKMAGQRAELEAERKNLRQRQQEIEQRLDAATKRFVDARDDVLKDLLTLAPLLNAVEFQTDRSRTADTAEAPPSASPEPRTFKLRPYLENALADREITETEFFDRFERHVRNSGYVYRRLDLVAFHVSVKVSDLTVLGGVSGTGKSSLPRLYAQALAGDVGAWDDRYRMVGVNPSWLDVGDLLGRVNVLDARFLPSDSGLYDLLIHAHEEYQRQTRNSGLYVVCLDEMNLAQVEHYFSPFLQLLEAPRDQRRLRCFAPASVSPDSDFAEWAELDLPPSLRFIGTVNFDETTRPLSRRVLDRINLITLHPVPLSELDAGGDQRPASPVSGPPVTHGRFESWRRPGQAGPVAEVLDELREPLRRLGCPLSPRRYRGLCEFLASARELITPEEALDMQITQRLLPQVRGLFRQSARDALEDLRTLLDAHGKRYSNALHALDELCDADDPWAQEPAE